MEITKEHARKVVETVKHGLCSGLGHPTPGQMCVEAAVCYALGAPHSDNHECIGYAVRAFKISLNDKCWSSNMARAKGLQRVAVAQLGSNTIDQIRFVTLLAERIVTLIPKPTAKSAESAEYAAKYAAESAAKSAAKSAESAAKSAAEYAEYAEYAAKYAEYAAKYAAESAAESAAKYAAESAAKYAAESAAKYDQVLSDAAEIAVQILIELKSPGTAYLSLCDAI